VREYALRIVKLKTKIYVRMQICGKISLSNLNSNNYRQWCTMHEYVCRLTVCIRNRVYLSDCSAHRRNATHVPFYDWPIVGHVVMIYLTTEDSNDQGRIRLRRMQHPLAEPSVSIAALVRPLHGDGEFAVPQSLCRFPHDTAPSAWMTPQQLQSGMIMRHMKED
jgi:hypothetical protein